MQPNGRPWRRTDGKGQISGNLYVADTANHTIRKIASGGVVSTLAGLAGVNGSSDGTGTAAEFNFPSGIAVNSQGYVFVADSANNTVRSQGIPPTIITQPQSQTNVLGSTVTFLVVGYGSSPFTYTWQFNSSPYPSGPNSSLVASNAGTYTVLVSNVAGSMLSSSATLTLTNPLGAPGLLGHIVVSSFRSPAQLAFSGTTNALYTLRHYTLQASTNLVTWTNLASFTQTNGAAEYLDPAATNFSVRFYRLVSP